MSRGVMASSQSCTAFSTSTIRRCCFIIPPTSRTNLSFPNSKSPRSLRTSRINLRCNSFGDSGGNIFKTTLDAFFLGKAVGEVLIERIESSVGEIRDFFGKWQTEQLKHLAQFQEDVLEKARRDKESAAVGVATSVVKEATHEVQELITSTTKQATQELITEASSTVKQATQLVSDAAATVEQATHLVSDAASTVEQATQEAHGLISEASSTVKEATQGAVSEAASTVAQATSEAKGLISEATSSAKHATEEAQGLLSEAVSTVSDVSKTISSVTGSVSSLLNPKK